ncbi:MAG: GGDEF domain-containing protein [Gammaproteobacteria bacterium]
MTEQHKELEKVIDADGIEHILRMLEPLKGSPAGTIIYEQITRALHDQVRQQNRMIRGYAALSQTLLSAFRKNLPKKSLLYLELKLIQKRMQPPISLGELATLQAYLNNATQLVNKVTDPDQELLREALAPLMGHCTTTEALPEAIEVPHDEKAYHLDELQHSIHDRVNSTAQTQEKLSNVLSDMLDRLVEQQPDGDWQAQRQWFMDRLKYLNENQTELLTSLNDTQSFLNLMGHSSRQLHEELDQARVLSLTDELTRLPNRRAFAQRLQDEIVRSEREKSPLTVAMIDLDDFKQINDHYGHTVGDEILRLYATSILSVFRRYDMVARYGGEEFAVILPNSSKVEALQAFVKVQQKAAASQYHTDGSVKRAPTFSAGLAIHRPGESMESLIDRADRMMYQAKRYGKNRIEFDNSYLTEKTMSTA